MSAQPAPRDQPVDPVLARRAAVLRWSDLGQRVAYLCFGLAVVVFVVAFIAQFPAWTVVVIVGLMAVGSVLFVPAVIFGYAAKAAEKEERGESSGH
ncbi:hypothetical protein [Dermatobacter hominis]|uniref:hypothetical protein n=1 Tax=Dermatobacter hominis TaxID=2884263 RepID=UPI001D11895D|nr:hypothetical protein [Dermatobacter hominis]UDY37299.1 hypothetical protein LH044_07105 [Dermatobacter hominis]